MDVRIGISGWTYKPWRGTFYPPGLPQRRELAHVAERMTSVEINGTFYSRQRPTSFASWAAAVPEDFVFSVKGPRFITHLKKLGDVAVPLANFWASGVLALGRGLGPCLWQLPPTLGFDAARMTTFFDLLPRTAGEAAALAAGHDARVPEDQALTTTTVPDHRLRHTVEVRHETFRDPAFYALLRRHDVGLVIADNPGRWPVIEERTTDFTYVRLHGHDELYASGYDDEALDAWAARARGWLAQGQDVYVYCDNDVKVRAPYDAMGLLARLRGESTGGG
ncbi:DUF72 domain-containing protein [Microlunatus capsulatus]|uniref:Uncharacterized protein YecE (DUF72 family) n=1 Tax=Microlunatus capsulatus TaxID=99117 RepID=A0ABS4Z922_9ACTN|nr:DUF72 domain-containing protein [Microlunatus capsulatus]MBP2417547.1 uncharacterized protein YecE (DUF72 family) [Microlunatus capsulatus]